MVAQVACNLWFWRQESVAPLPAWGFYAVINHGRIATLADNLTQDNLTHGKDTNESSVIPSDIGTDQR
jgi:predicted FMN-binding regulatory protein PaiB